MHSLVLQKIEHVAKATPDRVALKNSGALINYTSLAEHIKHFSIELEIFKGKCVGLELGNSPEWVIADLACIAAGVISIPIPPFFTDAQRQNAYEDAGVCAVIHDGLVITQKETTPVAIPEHTAKITYTSGTTSDPKGVCLSQEGMEQVAESLLAVLGSEAAKCTAAILPLGVLLENLAGCYTTLLAGGCYDVCPQADIGLNTSGQPDFVKLAGYLAESRATSCILVPELLRGLMQAMAQANICLPDMQFMAVGGSRVSPQLLQKAQVLGLPVYQGYGLSECASVVAVNTPEQHDITSVGKILPHIEVKITDDGEVCVHHPAFLGYLGEGKAPILYGTGDFGHIDEKGFLHITGRKKNIIITAYGRNVSPEWPESELLTQPAIMQCMVFGDAAPSLSALIVPLSPDVTTEMLQMAVSQANITLPGYAQVKQWHVVPPFTVGDGLLTGTGRPKRDAVYQAYHMLIKRLNEEESYANIL